jgi:hypothetical protein
MGFRVQGSSEGSGFRVQSSGSLFLALSLSLSLFITGTVTTKSQVLEETLPEDATGGALIATRTIEGPGGIAGSGTGGSSGSGGQQGGCQRPHDSLGLAFLHAPSEAERAERDAVLLPFQRHLHSVDGPCQDRGGVRLCVCVSVRT